jgi:hypothetical protein
MHAIQDAILGRAVLWRSLPDIKRKVIHGYLDLEAHSYAGTGFHPLSQ